MVLERGWLLTFKKEGSYEEPTETIDLREVKNIVLLGQHGHGFNFALSTASEQETDYFEFCIETEEEMISMFWPYYTDFYLVEWKDSISDQMTR